MRSHRQRCCTSVVAIIRPSASVVGVERSSNRYLAQVEKKQTTDRVTRNREQTKQTKQNPPPPALPNLTPTSPLTQSPFVSQLIKDVGHSIPVLQSIRKDQRSGSALEVHGCLQRRTGGGHLECHAKEEPRRGRGLVEPYPLRRLGRKTELIEGLSDVRKKKVGLRARGLVEA